MIGRYIEVMNTWIGVVCLIASLPVGLLIGRGLHRLALRHIDRNTETAARDRDLACQRAMGDIVPATDVTVDWDFDENGRYLDSPRNILRQSLRGMFIAALPAGFLLFAQISS